MAENNNIQKTKRALFAERLGKKYPDQAFDDDEVMFGRVNDDYDAYEKEIEDYKGRESKLSDLFAKDPRSAEFLTTMAKGGDPLVAVIQRMGIDGITDLLNDPEKMDAYAEANKEYIERTAKEKGLEEEYKKNFAKSMELLEIIQNERGLGDETIDAAMDLVMKMANEAVLGKFSAETINMALNAITHDADVTNARSEGNIAGRNAQIDEKLRKRGKSDGMPNLNGSNNAGGDRKRSRGALVDYAAEIGVDV